MPLSTSTLGLSDNVEPKTTSEFAQQMQHMMQQLQDKFQSTSGQIFTRIDETGRSLDDLEKTVSDLMTEAGVDQWSLYSHNVPVIQRLIDRSKRCATKEQLHNYDNIELLQLKNLAACLCY